MPAGRDPAPPGEWDLSAEAPAKLNLALEVLGKRRDGYHELRTVFQAIDLVDRLWFRERSGPGIRLRVEGSERVEAGPGNLVVRAAEALVRRRAPGRGAEILLRKQIPWGAGLGGGSSDAAATLLALERLWGLDPDPGLLAELALSLGSDVPFFLLGGTALGEGRGEILRPLPGPPECGWLLAVPSFRVSTAEVFRRFEPALTRKKEPARMLAESLVEGDFQRFLENLVNDLEVGVVRIEPRLARMRQDLLSLGAVAAALTGSGSAMFALVGTEGDATRLARGGAGAAWYTLSPCRPVTFGARVS